jgi:hypothetical protein
VTKRPDILDRAADLVERPGGWTQDALARDADGIGCDSMAARAVCWCAIGAIECAAEDDADAAAAAVLVRDELVRTGRPRSLSRFNDALGRTAAEVAGLLRNAARAARAA